MYVEERLLGFNPQKDFDFFRTQAKLYAALGRVKEARHSVIKALEAAKRERSGYAKHPKVGLVSTDDLTLERLRRIAGA